MAIPEEQKQKLRRFFSLSCLVLFGYFVLLCSWFHYYFTSSPIASVDLPGHIAVIERFVPHLLSGQLTFYDPAWFTGWPVFLFYGFLAHAFAALLSLPLSFISEEPVRLAVHVLLVVGAALLPWSIFRAARPLLAAFPQLQLSKGQLVEVSLAFTVGALTFWFLNHDHQWYGLGAAAPMNVGLFSQLFAWHFMLFHLAALFRLLNGGGWREVAWCALWFSLLIVTHALTAVFSLSIAGLACLWFARDRVVLLVAHGLGVGVAAFWIIPWLVFGSSYTSLDIHRPQGDFYELLLRYPVHGLLRAVSNFFNGEAFGQVEPTRIVVWLLLLLLLVSERVRKNRLLIPFVVFSLIALTIYSSGFVATSIPVGFHYYRFIAYTFLLVIVLLAAVPLAFFSHKETPAKPHRDGVLSGLIVILAIASTISTTQMPHYERKRIQESLADDYLRDERAVLDYLREQPDKTGRVLFEYFNNYDRYTWLGCHYMTSRLYKETGFETINGLYVQSSVAYRMPVASANLLGASTYNTPLLFTDRAELDDTTKIRQLKEFDVRYIVAGTKSFLERLAPFVSGEPVIIGRYSVLRIDPQPAKRISPVSKKVVGYIDTLNTLPFRFLEFYVYARRDLTTHLEVIALNPDEQVPEFVDIVVVNGELKTAAPAEVPVLRLDFKSVHPIDHYNVWYQHNVELDAYNETERYFDKTVQLRAALASHALQQEIEEVKITAAELSVEQQGQALRVLNLEPGTLYRINYSYLPFWATEDGPLYRGSGERVFFLAQKTQGYLRFSLWNSRIYIAGCAISGVSLTLLCLMLLIARPERRYQVL